MKTIPLNNGLFTTVDDFEYPFIKRFKWHLSSAPPQYAFTTICGKSIPLHRLILTPPPGKFLVDHINHDTLDNRKCNLRVATQSQNMMNQKPHQDACSSFKGIWKVGDCNRWAARIWDGKRKKRIHLGLFKTAEDAAHAYDKKALELFGEFARLNFPQYSPGGRP